MYIHFLPLWLPDQTTSSLEEGYQAAPAMSCSCVSESRHVGDPLNRSIANSLVSFDDPNDGNFVIQRGSILVTRTLQRMRVLEKRLRMFVLLAAGMKKSLIK